MTIAALRNSEGQFSENSGQTTRNALKHCNAGVGLMIASDRDGSESSVVVTALYRFLCFAIFLHVAKIKHF